MIMELLRSINRIIESRAHQYSAYITTLYFVEILYLMFGLLFFYGMAVSIITGIVLALFLAYHIIQLFFQKSLHRKLALYIIDIHAAFVIGYLITSIAAGSNYSGVPELVLGIRALTLVLELPLIIVLTRDTIVTGFK